MPPFGGGRDYAPVGRAGDAAKPEPNAALREIAGRIKKLSYRDMQRLAGAICDHGAGTTPPALIAAILDAADKLENA